MPNVTEDLKALDLPKDVLLDKIRNEHAQALNFVSPRRIQFRDRLRLYNNQRRQRDKIGITSIYTTINTLLAIHYIDELAVGFGGKGISGSDFAENIENVAKNDYEEMDLAIDKYIVHWDRFFFGVGIEHVHGWDLDRDTPMNEVMDPLSWLPDPNGFIKPGSFRFMGFELEMARGDMTENRGFIPECVKRLTKATPISDEQRQNKNARREAQGLGLNNPPLVTSQKDDDVIAIVNWFTIVNGQRFLCTVDVGMTEIVRFEHVKPVFEKEKDNELLTPWGIALHYYSPERGNPFGTSVPDLMEDKQRAKSVLANLKLLKEKADLYPMYLYNREKILNRRDLDFAFNKFIGVRGDVEGAAAPLRKDTNKVQNTENVTQTLDREGDLATGAGPNQAGVMTQDSRTLGENQMVQMNANLRFLLGSRINSWGEKDFWKLWYRCYVQFFDSAEEKIVEISNAYGITSQAIPGKKFLVYDRPPKVIIRSKLEVDQQRQREQVSFAAIAPLILQDPTKPAASRRFAERYLLTLNNVPKEKIEAMCPPTPDEMKAHRENMLLARNQVVKVELDEDHLSHMLVNGNASDTTAQRVHIEAHRQAYIASGQAERDKTLMLANAQNAKSMAPAAAGAAAGMAAGMIPSSQPGMASQGGNQSAP